MELTRRPYGAPTRSRRRLREPPCPMEGGSEFALLNIQRLAVLLYEKPQSRRSIGFHVCMGRVEWTVYSVFLFH